MIVERDVVDNITYVSDFISKQECLDSNGIGNVSIGYCQFNIEQFHNDMFDRLDILLPENIHDAVRKRQSEYLAGRYAAKLALLDLGVVDTEVLIGLNRSPVWPDGVLGSITHTGNDAYSMVSFANEYRYVGIDCEEIIDAETSHNIASSIANEQELNKLTNLGFDFSHALTIIFSAKESLFKALHPYARCYFDFSAAMMTEFSIEDNKFELILKTALCDSLPEDKVFRGVYKGGGNKVLTIILC